MPRAKKAMPESADAAVPLSAMIDVVFLLLIYFILTQKPVIEDVYLSVDLPAPNAGPPPKNKPPTLLRIDVMKLLSKDGDNYYHVNNQKYSKEQLKTYLESVARADENTTVIINCGPNAKHKKLIQLLDMCNELKLTKLNLVNDESVEFKPEAPIKRK